MKKLVSVILAGAVMLGLSACVNNSGANGPDAITDETVSESEVAEEETSETSETTAEEAVETSDETTAETSAETSVVSSEETVADPDEVIVVAESESKETEAVKPSIDDFAADKIPGKISTDFNEVTYSDIAEAVLKLVSLGSTQSPDEFADKFSVKPKYSYKNGVWTFEWDENNSSKNSYRQITIKARNVNNKIVLDKNSEISISMLFQDYDKGQEVLNTLSGILASGEPYDVLKGELKIDPKYCDCYLGIFEDDCNGYKYGATELLVECSLPTWVREGRTYDD